MLPHDDKKRVQQRILSVVSKLIEYTLLREFAQEREMGALAAIPITSPNRL